jgi:hypothetical protein
VRKRSHREILGQGEVVRMAKMRGWRLGELGEIISPNFFYFVMIFRIVSALHPLAMAILAI